MCVIIHYPSTVKNWLIKLSVHWIPTSWKGGWVLLTKRAITQIEMDETTYIFIDGWNHAIFIMILEAHCYLFASMPYFTFPFNIYKMQNHYTKYYLLVPSYILFDDIYFTWLVI